MAAKKKARKYGKRAAAKVARVMHERKEGTLALGPLRKEGDEPQAGDRDRALRGAQGGGQGAEQEVSSPQEERVTARRLH